MSQKIDIQHIIDIAQAAGKVILDIYQQDFEVLQKADSSPLTLADRAANEVILAGLQKHYPNIPFISEETKQLPYTERKNWSSCWLIDPLDGTKEFIKRNGEFTVNIALIKDGQPILGVIYVPVQHVTYYAEMGKGSYKIDQSGVCQVIKASGVVDGVLKMVCSRSHLNEATQAYLEKQKATYSQVETVAAGSSLKLCLVAEGKAHLYPRFAPTMEWDIGAGHIIAQEAGASICVYPTGRTLCYNKENLLNPHFLVSSVD